MKRFRSFWAVLFLFFFCVPFSSAFGQTTYSSAYDYFLNETRAGNGDSLKLFNQRFQQDASENLIVRVLGSAKKVSDKDGYELVTLVWGAVYVTSWTAKKGDDGAYVISDKKWAYATKAGLMRKYPGGYSSQIGSGDYYDNPHYVNYPLTSYDGENQDFFTYDEIVTFFGKTVSFYELVESKGVTLHYPIPDFMKEYATFDTDGGGVADLREWIRDTSLTDPADDNPEDDNDCECDACCSCECTCGNWTGSECDGTYGAFGCECHAGGDNPENACECGASCFHCCTCGKWSGPECDGTDGPNGCACHSGGGGEDPENDCVCGACCSCECECGFWSGANCNGTNGEGGCACHSGGGGEDPENDCVCGACCSCECECGFWSGANCNGTNGAGGCACHSGGGGGGGENPDDGCTCGACCSCECSCGNWTGGECDGTNGENGCSCRSGGGGGGEDPEDECVCAEACCACHCECTAHESGHGYHGNGFIGCDGTGEGDGLGCSCHTLDDCTCVGKCVHCCDCRFHANDPNHLSDHGACGGTAIFCDCHNDVPDCVCANYCCECVCQCPAHEDGSRHGSHSNGRETCDGSPGSLSSSGCVCHNACTCSVYCCIHTCECSAHADGSSHQGHSDGYINCDGTSGANGCDCHEGGDEEECVCSRYCCACACQCRYCSTSGGHRNHGNGSYRCTGTDGEGGCDVCHRCTCRGAFCLNACNCVACASDSSTAHANRHIVCTCDVCRCAPGNCVCGTVEPNCDCDASVCVRACACSACNGDVAGSNDSIEHRAKHRVCNCVSCGCYPGNCRCSDSTDLSCEYYHCSCVCPNKTHAVHQNGVVACSGNNKSVDANGCYCHTYQPPEEDVCTCSSYCCKCKCKCERCADSAHIKPHGNGLLECSGATGEGGCSCHGGGTTETNPGGPEAEIPTEERKGGFIEYYYKFRPSLEKLDAALDARFHIRGFEKILEGSHNGTLPSWTIPTEFGELTLDMNDLKDYDAFSILRLMLVGLVALTTFAQVFHSLRKLL